MATEHLNYIGFQLRDPAPELRSHIRSYWLIEHDYYADFSPEEFMHPEGGFGLVFNWGDALYFDGEAITEPYFLDGANTQSRRLVFQKQVRSLGIRFFTGGAYPFFGIPLHELRDEMILLDDFWGEIEFLYEQLGEAESFDIQAKMLDHWLIKRLVDAPEERPIVRASLQLLHAQMPIPSIAEQLAISQRQLERLYRLQIGISPKQYTRLQRVNHARGLLKQLKDESLATVSADLGYYDQAHFIRDFKGIVGMTPLRYLQRRNPS